MNISQTTENHEIAPGIEGKVLSIRTQCPLDQLLLGLVIQTIEQQSPPQYYYLGCVTEKPAYGHPTSIYKIGIPLSELKDYDLPERLFTAPPFFKQK